MESSDYQSKNDAQFRHGEALHHAIPGSNFEGSIRSLERQEVVLDLGARYQIPLEEYSSADSIISDQG